MGDDPFRDLAHVFVLDEEIAGRAAAFANECASWDRVRRQHVDQAFGAIPRLDVPREFDR
jgi:hypothetical protein